MAFAVRALPTKPGRGNLEANRDKVIEIQSKEVHDRYMNCLHGCQQTTRYSTSTW
jgi:cyclopropane fatty-acyl-phospholipid synthase-like methyltransferase